MVGSFNLTGVTAKAEVKASELFTKAKAKLPPEKLDKASAEMAKFKTQVSSKTSDLKATAMKNPEVSKAHSWWKGNSTEGSAWKNNQVTLYMQHNFPGISQWFSKTFANTRPMT